jgi:putative transposase
MGVHAAPHLSAALYYGLRDYSITCCTFNRHPWFQDASIVERVRAPLLELAREEQFAIPAYCFMPDHTHLLVEGTSLTSDLRRLMNRWKQTTGHTHRRSASERLWQGGYYDHILREDEDRAEVLRYLLQNPIRAGLVSSVEDYPFWGSSIWSRNDLLTTFFDDSERQPSAG